MTPRLAMLLLRGSLAFPFLGCASSNSLESDAAGPTAMLDSGRARTSATPDGGATRPTRMDAAAAPERDAAAPSTARDAAMSDAAPRAPDAMAVVDAASGALAPTCVGGPKLESYVSDPKLCVHVFAQDVGSARQLAFAPNGDLFVNNGQVVVLWDDDDDGASDASERATFARADSLNHGLAFSRDNRFVYASSSTTVYRWPYTPGQRMAQAAAEVVIDGIPAAGHNSRTLGFDSLGRLIVSVGSAGNVDTDQSDWDNRSQVRRFTVPASLPAAGLAYSNGEVIATGMRNEAGLFVDSDDRIWGVENGRDNLSDADLGGDIHNDNPGEEINLIDGREPKFYGYPRCFSEYLLSDGRGPGSQWADQTLASNLQQTDEFCQNPAMVRPPVYVMPAHWAPLGIIRYRGRALPMDGDLIIGAHGSWNRDPASGRVVARARLEGDRVTSFEVLIGEKNAAGELKQGTWNARPVDVRQGPDDAIYVSDDLGGRILKIGYDH